MSLSHTLNAIHISYSAFSIYLQLREYVNLRNIEFFVEVDFEIKIFLLKKLNPMMMMRRNENICSVRQEKLNNGKSSTTQEMMIRQREHAGGRERGGWRENTKYNKHRHRILCGDSILGGKKLLTRSLRKEPTIDWRICARDLLKPSPGDDTIVI